MVVLLELVGEAGVDMVESDLTTMPTGRREVELLIAADDADAAKRTAIELCTKAFGDTALPV